MYYHRPPTRAERTRAVERSGGRLIGLDQDEVEWEEQMSFGGFPVTTSSLMRPGIRPEEGPARGR